MNHFVTTELEGVPNLRRVASKSTLMRRCGTNQRHAAPCMDNDTVPSGAYSPTMSPWCTMFWSV